MEKVDGEGWWDKADGRIKNNLLMGNKISNSFLSKLLVHYTRKT
jgi:hypothetical protein